MISGHSSQSIIMKYVHRIVFQKYRMIIKLVYNLMKPTSAYRINLFHILERRTLTTTTPDSLTKRPGDGRTFSKQDLAKLNMLQEAKEKAQKKEKKEV